MWLLTGLKKISQLEVLPRPVSFFVHYFAVSIETLIHVFNCIVRIASGGNPMDIALLSSYIYRLFIVIITLLYVLSPLDIIPDVFPVIGQIDDLLAVVWAAKKLGYGPAAAKWIVFLGQRSNNVEQAHGWYITIRRIVMLVYEWYIAARLTIKQLQEQVIPSMYLLQHRLAEWFDFGFRMLIGSVIGIVLLSAILGATTLAPLSP